VGELLVPADPASPAGAVVVELTLDRPVDSLAGPQQEQFLRAVKDRLSLAGDVRVLNRPQNSLGVALELAAANADKLFWGVLEGRLSDLGIEGARLIVEGGLKRTDSPHPGPALPSTPPAGRTRCTVLLVDDEHCMRDVLRRLLEPHFDVLEAPSADAAEAIFAQRPIDLLLTDQKMPRRTGVQLLEWVRQNHPRTIGLLMTGYGHLVEDVIAAINRGHVYHYFTKPFPHDLLRVLLMAAEKVALERKRDRLLVKLRDSNRKLRKRKRLLEKANEQLRAELQRKAVTDPQTGLLNRVGIEAQVRGELESRVRDRPLSIGLVEIDQAVTTEVVKRLEGVLRATDSIGRLGEARFLILARATGEHGAERLGQRLLATVPTRLGEPLTLSIGFAVVDPEVHDGFDALLGLATTALEQARSAGGNHCKVRKLPKAVP
jgi:PleD family two-component response regulator